MLKNNESSVLFSIGSVIEIQHEKERDRQAEQQRQRDAQERAEAARVDHARRVAGEAERTRQAADAETARYEWERQVADKEAAICACIEADTERELEMLRAEYRDAEPVVVPGRHRLSVAVASLMVLAALGLGAFGVHAMTDQHQLPIARTATASKANPSKAKPRAAEVPPKPEVLAPAPMTTIRIAEPTTVKMDQPVTRPIVKPYKIPTRPRCRWITITKRVQNPLWNHPLNFEGRYKIIKKRVKKCRK